MKMTDAQIEEMLKDILQEYDSDAYDYTYGHMVECPEENKEHRKQLIKVVKKHLKKI